MRLRFSLTIVLTSLCLVGMTGKGIDRKKVVERNSPRITRIDSLEAFTVGNGNFAYTVDVTGLQTFPEKYSKGICLGTMSNWGWHSMPNPEKYTIEETLATFDFGRGHKEVYTTMPKARRQRKASLYFDVNPHRLHLGVIGLDIPLSDISKIKDIDQRLSMYNGVIDSRFTYKGHKFHNETVCHPNRDMISAHISSDISMPVVLRFPYPTGVHSDDGCKWNVDDKHKTEILENGKQYATIRRTIDSTVYYVKVSWTGQAEIVFKGKNKLLLVPKVKDFTVTCEFCPANRFAKSPSFATIKKEVAEHWNSYWKRGAIVDFSTCKDPRAKELERRVVESQYIMASQEAGDVPPQETGLTYNSWYGKFHLEMTWWHAAHWALWGHPELLQRQMDWYFTVEDKAREIAKRQGFDGVRWMKSCDPSGIEAPSIIGSFLIWQQPHIIYFAELLYRTNPSKAILQKYNRLVQETAEFMASFATYDKARGQYILKGYVPAQEVCEASQTLNSPLELSYWHFGLSVAQKWRERMGEKRITKWDDIISKLAPLASDSEGRYVAAENAPDTYAGGEKYINDHPAVLGAVGMLPMSPLVETSKMRNTLNYIYDHWRWQSAWGWDFPMGAMCAARIGEPQKAVDLLLMKQKKNTYLLAGQNYQNEMWRLYNPGNGGLLTAIAMMCAGWDGSKGVNPGFPKDGQWNVRWEGLKPLP